MKEQKGSFLPSFVQSFGGLSCKLSIEMSLNTKEDY